MINNIGASNIATEHCKLLPDESLQDFIKDCNSTSEDLDKKFQEHAEEFPNPINSKYYNLSEFNQIKHDQSASFSLLHTNLASINKHFDELTHILTEIKTKFDIIGISEHKLNDVQTPLLNLDIPGYHSFTFDSSNATHGGTGIFIKNSIIFNRRDDLKFYSLGDFESTFVELIFPNKKNMIIGCIYRHPTSKLSITKFNNEVIEPLLDKIAKEDKSCCLMGDFNIDLVKTDSNDQTNDFFTTLTSNYFTPYILQPTRLQSKTN